MKTCLLVLLALPCCAQLPTAGLVVQYDMLTVSGGTTLTDLSGHGNNGTLHGTSQTAFGTTFNGSSDYIGMPATIVNSPFTMLCLAQQKTGGGSGALWSETNGTENYMLRFGPDSGNWINVTGNNGSTSTSLNSRVNMPNKYPDYDVYYMQRSFTGLTGGRLSRQNGTGSNTLTAVTTVTTTLGALGAEDLGASRANFWTGTLAYFVLYNRTLSTTEMQTAYAAMATAVQSRPVVVQPYPIPVFTGPVWQRQGAVFNMPGTTSAPGEPLVMWDGNPQVLTSLTSVFKMWFSCYASPCSGGTGYAESADGFSWTMYNSGAAVIPSPHARPGIAKINGTYYGLVETNSALSTSNVSFDLYSSADGVAWTLVQAAVLSKSVSGWDSSGVNNPFLSYSVGTWYLSYESNGSWGTATSTNGTVWTKSLLTGTSAISASDLAFVQQGGTSCQGPATYAISGNWYTWCGAVQCTVVCGLARFTSPQFNNALWALNPYKFILRGEANDETGGVQDPSLVEVNGKTYLFYASSQTGGQYSGIKLAIANMTLAQLVLTSEDTFNDIP